MKAFIFKGHGHSVVVIADNVGKAKEIFLTEKCAIDPRPHGWHELSKKKFIEEYYSISEEELKKGILHDHQEPYPDG